MRRLIQSAARLVYRTRGRQMDMEGGEFELLPAMRAFLEAERPALQLSLHATLLPERGRKQRVAKILDLVGIDGTLPEASENDVRAPLG